MKSIAIYSPKGGVGKTTLAVNLAWASATLSARRTLLWDLDPQAASSFLLGAERRVSRQARTAFTREVALEKLVRPTAIERLSLLGSDPSLRALNLYLHELGKKRRLEKLLAEVAKHFDRIILDCPPGLTETTEQVVAAADLIIVPVIPSPLSQRALAELFDLLDSKKIARNLVLPVFNMVDRRRTLHGEALAAEPRWPTIPVASMFEAMSAGRRAIGETPPGSAAGQGVAQLWAAIEKRLAR